MTTGCQSVSGSSILPIRTRKQILKDIQSVDNQSPINKRIFSISVDKYGDMCIKGQDSPAGGLSLMPFSGKNTHLCFL